MCAILLFIEAYQVSKFLPYKPFLALGAITVVGGLTWKSVNAPPSAPTPPAVVINPARASNEHLAIANTLPLRGFVVGTLLDKSGSLGHDHNATPTIEHLAPLIDLLVQRGGVKAVGSICGDQAMQALLRVRIDEPPILDPERLKNPTPPPPVPEGLNAFDTLEAEKHRAPLIAAYEEAIAEDNAVIAEVDAERAAHQQEATAEAESFLETAQPLLEAPATCETSNVNEAMTRTLTLLNENPASWRQPPARFLLVVSDGLETTGHSPVSVDEDITVLVVGPQTENSVFQKIAHERFESIEAAIAYIIAVAEEN